MSGFVLGFDEDDGEVIDFDDDSTNTADTRSSAVQTKPTKHINLECSSDHTYYLIVQLQIFICIVISETGMVSIAM